MKVGNPEDHDDLFLHAPRSRHEYLGMNYTLNRPLFDGRAASRVEEVRSIASKIVDFNSWHQCWLDLARQAEQESRWLDAATYYHQAEFYLPAGEVRNGLYDDFARAFARGMEVHCLCKRAADLVGDVAVKVLGRDDLDRVRPCDGHRPEGAEKRTEEQ
jgi:hypothetical protein